MYIPEPVVAGDRTCIVVVPVCPGRSVNEVSNREIIQPSFVGGFKVSKNSEASQAGLSVLVNATEYCTSLPAGPAGDCAGVITNVGFPCTHPTDALTVSNVPPVSEPSVADMVEDPIAFVVAKPPGVIVAVVGFDDCHVT